jgi:hypothetical protein
MPRPVRCGVRRSAQARKNHAASFGVVGSAILDVSGCQCLARKCQGLEFSVSIALLYVRLAIIFNIRLNTFQGPELTTPETIQGIAQFLHFQNR